MGTREQDSSTTCTPSLMQYPLAVTCRLSKKDASRTPDSHKTCLRYAERDARRRRRRGRPQVVTCFWTLKMSRERDRNSPKGCNNNPFGHLLGCPFWGEGSFGGAYSPFWKNSSSHRKSASRHPPDHAGTRQGQPGNQSRVHRNPLKDNLIEARPGQVTHTLSLFLSLSPSLSLLIRNRVACWWNNSQR